MSSALARAPLAGFDSGYVLVCAAFGEVDEVEDGETEESPSSHSSPGALHPRFSRTLVDSPFWWYVSRE